MTRLRLAKRRAGIVTQVRRFAAGRREVAQLARVRGEVVETRAAESKASIKRY